MGAGTVNTLQSTVETTTTNDGTNDVFNSPVMLDIGLVQESCRSVCVSRRPLTWCAFISARLIWPAWLKDQGCGCGHCIDETTKMWQSDLLPWRSHPSRRLPASCQGGSHMHMPSRGHFLKETTGFVVAVAASECQRDLGLDVALSCVKDQGDARPASLHGVDLDHSTSHAHMR